MSGEELLRQSQWYFDQAGIDVPRNDYSAAVVDLVKERCKTLLDVVQQSRFFFTQIESYDEVQMAKHIKTVSPELLLSCINKLSDIQEWTIESIHGCIQGTVEEFAVGFGKVAQPIRIALTGSTISPSIDQTLWVLGKQESLTRLHAALPVFKTQLEQRDQ